MQYYIARARRRCDQRIVFLRPKAGEAGSGGHFDDCDGTSMSTVRWYEVAVCVSGLNEAIVCVDGAKQRIVGSTAMQSSAGGVCQ
jgi:hypothetical protein